MENKLMNLLEQLSVEQTDQLISSEGSMKLSKKTQKRIERSVFEKAGLKQPKAIFRKQRLVVFSSALVLVVLSVFLIGPKKVGNAINRLFRLIPGVGIVDETSPIEYVLVKQETTENEKYKITLNHAVATKDSVTVMFSIDRKNIEEEQFTKEKEEEWKNLVAGGTLKKSSVILYSDDTTYDDYSGYTGSGTTSDISTFTFPVKENQVGPDHLYRLEFADLPLSLSFSLKKYESFESLTDIGATDVHNNISITAVPSFLEGNRLQVDLYSINQSFYRLVSFVKTTEPYQQKDLTLQTDSGQKTYRQPDGYSGRNEKFLFDIEETDQSFTLSIPYLVVSSDEQEEIKLPIPKLGEVKDVNKTITFDGCTIHIKSVEKVFYDDGNAQLKINVTYEEKDSNLKMIYPLLDAVGAFGGKKSSSWSTIADENGQYKTFFFSISEKDGSSIKLRFSKPQYFLLSEYELSFQREAK